MSFCFVKHSVGRPRKRDFASFEEKVKQLFVDVDEAGGSDAGGEPETQASKVLKTNTRNKGKPKTIWEKKRILEYHDKLPPGSNRITETAKNFGIACPGMVFRLAC
jgi:hypothetical protein